jgi:hypothetical protein
VPGANDPQKLFGLANGALAGLSMTPVGPEGADETLGAESLLKIFIDHEHAAQHLEEIGLGTGVVDSAIRTDIAKQGAIPLQTFIARTINIGDHQVEYHPYSWTDGVINVGTYFIRQ